MRAIKSKVCRALPLGAHIHIADNSGARIVKIISVKRIKTRTRRLASAAIADMITGSVVAGKPDMVHKVVQGVIVRQKKEYQRPDGTRIKFEDNAGIILKDIKLGMPKGTMIKGPIAKEAAMRWPQVAKIASIVL